MKNDIKKYLTLGAVLAGSSMLISCGTIETSDGSKAKVFLVSATLPDGSKLDSTESNKTARQGILWWGIQGVADILGDAYKSVTNTSSNNGVIKAVDGNGVTKALDDNATKTAIERIKAKSLLDLKNADPLP